MVFAGHPAPVLTWTAVGDDGVDVHAVDLPGQTVAGGGVARRSLTQQEHHDGIVRRLAVGQVGHSGGAGGQAGVEPVIIDPRWIGPDESGEFDGGVEREALSWRGDGARA